MFVKFYNPSTISDRVDVFPQGILTWKFLRSMTSDDVQFICQVLQLCEEKKLSAK